MADEVQYEFKAVRAVRGTESRSIAKWQKAGWELVDQDRGKVRTTLNFRRPKAKVPWVPIAVAAGIVLILAVVGGVAAAMQGGNDDKDPVAAPTKPAVVESQEPSKTPEPSDTSTAAEPEQEPDEAEAGSDEAPQVLTVENSPDLAAALSVRENCHERLVHFADKYAGRAIEFDGSIVNMANHGDYDTRVDILLAPGNKGPRTTVGPSFKYQDVSIVYDLGLTGPNVPDFVGEGDTFRFTAEVGEYNADNCLFFLDPVETKVR